MGENKFWLSGENVTLRGVGEIVFWAYPTIVVQDTCDLVILYMPANVIGKNTDHRPSAKELRFPKKINIVDHQWRKTDVLILIVPGDSFSTYLMWEAGTKNVDCWYINLQEPIRRTPIGFDTLDNMLDIVINPDMTEWEWKDADEFAAAQKVGYYSIEKANAIWSEGEKAVSLVMTKRRSIYKQWENWQANPEWEIPKLSPLWDKLNFDGNSLQK